MCGISGYVSDRKFDGAKMVSSLKHRGPDHTGEYSEVFYDKHIFLGHNRLSIIDLSENGNQPMSTLDGLIQLVFNGEIYNFSELKNKFLKNYSFKSKTDTEVILYLYKELGIDFINELNGDFAIAVFDKRISRLFLIRDRAGIKPLYYYYKDNSLIFASEIKAIIASGIKSELAEENILNYFVFKYSPSDTTLFKDIKKLNPSSYLEYNFYDNKIQIHKYWSLSKKPEYCKLSYPEAQEVFYNLIKDATELRLISDVPVGTFLSGGLDSSIIASFLKNNHSITHYCASKNSADLRKEGTTSDFYYASKLAKDWNLNLSEINIGSDEANLDQIKTTIYYSDDLIADGSQITSYLITKAASKNSKVILSGMGADELFLGYAGHLLVLLSQSIDKMPAFVSNPLMNLFGSVSQGKGFMLAYRRYIHKIGKYYSYPENSKYGFYTIVGDFENACSVYNDNKELPIQYISNYFSKGKDIFECLSHFEEENFLVKNLHYIDKVSMANSVECRVPFLDHRLMEFAYSIPREYKLSNTFKSKRILKDAFRSKLPDYVLNRRKAGFGMPLRSIFSSREKVNQLLDMSFFSNFNRFSTNGINQVIEKHISGKEDTSALIYALISFQEWYKMNF